MKTITSIQKLLVLILNLLIYLQFSIAQTTCTDPTATYQYDNSSNPDDCCWFINLNNSGVSNLITAIELDNFIDCEIGGLTANGGWTISSQTNTGAIVLPNTPYIQPGTYTQQFKVCLSNRTAIPHFFDVVFLETDAGGSYQEYCRVNFPIDCELSPICPLTCPVDKIDLVVNGDFTAGNINFNSGLTVNCNCQSGTYCITTDAKLKCNNSLWDPIMSPDLDNYMVIDGAVGSIWSQTVNVSGGQPYTFSFDYYPNISGDPGPSLSLYVGGNMLLDNITGTDDVWTKHCIDFMSATDNSLLIEIRQDNSIGFDDYGIDNVEFATCDGTIAVNDQVGFSSTVSIYPNPTDGAIQMELDESFKVDIHYQLYDLLGRQLRQGTINQGATRQELSMEGLVDGIYYLLLGNETTGYHQEKIVKRNNK